ncbi:hypothetical protein ACFQO8_14570 [Exiguobacterium aestuarii]|uniref:Uncharacterized protein n=1 Tax=Exiguobacterium aestuarii TaxID=273527 RepID=A0ABW2PVB4_9BACL|nr:MULTISPECIES: hypothetical protein [Exiguobacterium]MCT4786257.1 hypothetical protein [Exiguobacterium aestuarii]
MAWHIHIINPGPAGGLTSAFSDHIYVYDEDAFSGHTTLFLGSPHLDVLEDPTRALIRAKILISVFTSIQRLSYDRILRYDDGFIYYTDYSNPNKNRRENLGAFSEEVAFEEAMYPFSNPPISKFTYYNQYNHYFTLAQNEHLVFSVLTLLDEAYKHANYFYINLYKIVETIRNEWGINSMTEYSSEVVDAFNFLSGSNIKGYMNNFEASSLFSRHGYKKSKGSSEDLPLSIKNPPSISEIKINLLILINGWLNYKINSKRITYTLKQNDQA